MPTKLILQCWQRWNSPPAASESFWRVRARWVLMGLAAMLAWRVLLGR